MTNDRVDNFILKDQNGNKFDLYEKLDKNILLIFYPKDSSRVCSRQLSDYQQNETLFDQNDVKVVGINIEDIKSHGKFCEEIGIRFPLLCDVDKEVSRKFGALNILGMNKRKLVLIGIDKKILFEENISYMSYPRTEEIIENLQNRKII